MNLQIIRDDYYEDNLLITLVKMVPEFRSVYDFSYGANVILGDFSSFIVENINDESIVRKCFYFINESLDRGKHRTVDSFELYIFPALSEREDVIKVTKKHLTGRALDLFLKYLG